MATSSLNHELLKVEKLKLQLHKINHLLAYDFLPKMNTKYNNALAFLLIFVLHEGFVKVA